MGRLVDLADVLRGAGLTVIEVDGWRTRGKDRLTVQAIVWHHTATGPSWTDRRVVDLLRDGRPDVPGPLSQLGLDRAGRFHLVAAGRANHNGYGTYGNDAIGIEAFNNGIGEPWPAAQLRAYDLGTAALCRAYGVSTARVLGHRETDPRRKPDPVGIDMNAARQRVAQLLTYQPPAKPPAPPTTGDLTMSEAAAIRQELAEHKKRTTVFHEIQTQGLADRLVRERQTTEAQIGVVIGWARNRLNSTDADVAELLERIRCTDAPPPTGRG